MTDERPGHVTPPDDLRNLPAWWASRTMAEWRDRTVWGKLWFPLWLFYAVCLWAFAIPFGTTVFVAKWALHHTRRLKPSTYKDDC